MTIGANPRSNPSHVLATVAARKGLAPTAASSPVLMGVDVERPYACAQCGARVMLCAADPLPVGWRALGAGRGTVYRCGGCSNSVEH